MANIYSEGTIAKILELNATDLARRIADSYMKTLVPTGQIDRSILDPSKYAELYLKVYEDALTKIGEHENSLKETANSGFSII